MRLALVLVLGLTAALVTWGTARARKRAEERREARIEGRQDADRDIEKGTPWLCREFHSWGRLPRDGIGVDLETGLPLVNTTEWCGTCAALWGHIKDAWNEGYNERIREAFTAGRMDGFRLDRKVRDKPTLRTLFATGQPTVLKGDGATALVGQVAVVLIEYEDLTQIELTPADRRQRVLYARYPYEFADAPERLWMQCAPGPFEVLIVDDETTAILRDGEGYVWTFDLPRGLILEVAGPIR